MPAALQLDKSEVARPARAPRRAPSQTSINMRVSRQTLNMIDDAASVIGKSRTEFMLDSARRQAVDVLLDRRLFVLSAEQHDVFMAALDNPPAPSERLRDLMRRTPAWER